MFGDRSVIFLSLICSLIPLRSEDKLYDFSSSGFVFCLRMCSHSECSMCVFKRVCILLVMYFAVVDEVSYKCHLGPVHDGII